MLEATNEGQLKAATYIIPPIILIQIFKLPTATLKPLHNIGKTKKQKC